MANLILKSFDAEDRIFSGGPQTYAPASRPSTHISLTSMDGTPSDSRSPALPLSETQAAEETLAWSRHRRKRFVLPGMQLPSLASQSIP